MHVEVRKWVPHPSVLSIALLIVVVVYFASIYAMVANGAGFWQAVMVTTAVAFVVPFIAYIGLTCGSRYFPSDRAENRAMRSRCAICSFTMTFVFMVSTMISFS